jgi:hypothetical protein
MDRLIAAFGRGDRTHRVGFAFILPPAERLRTAHQIPGEAVGERRGRSSASPTWTGYLPAAGTVGITRYGPLDPSLVRRCADLHPAGGRNWRIFEWHPAPGAKPADARLYDDARRELRKLYDNRCRVVFAGWWLNEDPTFPLDGSRFADAIRDFLAERTVGR